MSPAASIEGSVPNVIRHYFAAHDKRDADAAVATFAEDATVFDDGHEYVGSDRIRHWLVHASTEFTYTRTIVAAQATGPDTWVITNHLEGNFPGGVVDLRYQFALTGDLIATLTIAP